MAHGTDFVRWIAYGYRKLTVCLRREYQLQINKKKVYRLCKKLDILLPQRRKPVVYPRKLARNRTVTDSNQLFETDIKYGFIAGEERFFFYSVLHRCIRPLDCSLSHRTELRSKRLQVHFKITLMKRQLFETLEKPVIRSDNGPQFISVPFGEACRTKLRSGTRTNSAKTPNMNAHIESFHQLLQDECLARTGTLISVL
ncbi:IS3 family transposase [Paenibacillus larvae]|uniref:IS3 family transposase n=1 Tax=Paenibacillus larvae TaxID=1464 RepID=UPI0037C71A85